MKKHKNVCRFISVRLLVLAVAMATLATTPVWAAPGGNTKLTKKVIEHLNFMREEEKLAHDVYVYMYQRWNAEENAEIFNLISLSEQQHMDTMLKMLIKYDLPDSASSEFGVFNNEDLQDKYYALTSIGEVDYLSALHKVGGFIEELDMIDIQEAIDVNQTPIDLTTAYEHLKKKKKNHLRAFVDALDSQLDYDYDEAQLLDQELFDAIIYIY